MSETTGSPPRAHRLERQLAECYATMESLRKSEERFRLLVERAQDIVYRFSVERREFDYVSPMVLSTTGYSPSELYDAPEIVLELVHPGDRAAVNEYWEESDLGRPLSCRLVHIDGRTIWVEHRSLPIYGEEGRLVAVEGVVRDVSENARLLSEAEGHGERLENEVSRRRRAEKMLRRFSSRLVNYQEEERRQVAHKLHDGVSQWLCGVGFNLESLQAELESGSDPSQVVTQTKELVDKCIDEIRKISQSLRPGILDDIGLVPAIRYLLEEFEKSSDVVVSARLPTERTDISAELDTTVFRLLQETVAAVGAKRGVSTLDLVLTCDDEQLSISLADDGEAYTNGNGPQWGPQVIVESLRERAGFAGGTVTTVDTPRGFVLEIHFPMPTGEMGDD